ncbi:MAG: hypothetical protein ACPGLV_10585 [Bacteroidia bacterium]
MKKLIILVFVLLTISTMGSLSNLDSIAAIKLEQKIVSIQSRIHKAFVNGKINVYQNDSLKTPMTLKMYNSFYGDINQADWASSMSASVKLNSDFTSFKQIRQIECISPMFNLNIDGEDLGVLPMYYVAIDDLAKVLEPNEMNLLAVLFNLAETNLSNNKGLGTHVLYQNDIVKTTRVQPYISEKMTNWVYNRQSVVVYPKDLREILKNSIYVLEESLNNVLCNREPNMSCFLDKKLKNEVKHLGVNNELSLEVIIQVPDASAMGQFKDTVIYKYTEIEMINNVAILKNAVQIDFSDLTIYMRKSDFEAAVPKWVRVLLLDDI